MKKFILPILLLLSTNCFAVDTLTNGLILHYKFDEGSGSTTNDFSATNADGTLNGTAGFSTTVPTAITYTNPYSLTLPALGDYVAIPVSSTFDFSFPFSVSTWYRTANVGGNDSGGMIFFRGITGHNNVFISVSNAGTIRFVYRDASDVNKFDITSTAQISNNTWYRITCTYDGTTALIYVNNNVVKTGTGSGFIAALANTGTCRISHSSTTFRLTGFFEDYRVYNRALSQAEVVLLANGGQYYEMNQIYAGQFYQGTIS